MERFKKGYCAFGIIGIFFATCVAALPSTSSTTEKELVTESSSAPIVAHFLGIFDDEWDVAWSDRVRDDTPFDKMNKLYIAFAHSYEDPENPGKFILDYENARNGIVLPGDTDADRIDSLVESARAKNDDIKILISLGWGLGDIAVIATDPEHYAASVIDFVRRHELDGFDFDFQPPHLPIQSEFTMIAETMRDAIDTATIEDEREANPYLMTITPSTRSSYTNWDVLSEYFDYFNLHTYWASPLGLLGYFLREGVPAEKITLGVLSEGFEDNPKLADIQVRVDLVEEYELAGMYAWRLDHDWLLIDGNKPAYEFAEEMWAQLGS